MNSQRKERRYEAELISTFSQRDLRQQQIEATDKADWSSCVVDGTQSGNGRPSIIANTLAIILCFA